MSQDLGWYVNRLRAMSIAEAAHRSYRAARYPIDQLRMRAGLYARPSPEMRRHLAQWRGPEPFYFDRDLLAIPVTPELRDEAEAICAGRRRVLGLGWVAVPQHGWHYEPNAKREWPRVDAARVVRTAPGHFDPRLTWELNRGHAWVVLARVYAATRDRRFRDQLVRELASWREHNPVGVGINWVSAMEAAIRIHSLAWVAGFLRAARTGLLPELATMIHAHATFVAEHRSYFSSANNHLIVELSGLVVAALAVGGELQGLYAPARRELAHELDRQIYADGVDAEMATHYHLFVLEALLLVAHLERAHGHDTTAIATVIQRMAEYVAALRCGDGSLLQQGDNDDGCILALLRPRHADQLLAAAAAIAPTPRPFAPARPGALEGAFWLTGATAPARVAPVRARSRRFPQSGQIVLRSSRLHAAFDAGPFGFGTLAAHAHCDALALALAIDGQRVLVDRGTYRYNGEPRERDRFRQTAAHNTVQIGALEQGAVAGPFLWARQPVATIQRCRLAADGDIVVARHDGFRAWVHRRTLVHHGSVLVVVDDIVGPPPTERVIARFHLAPELAVRADDAPPFRIVRGETPLAWVATNARSARVVTGPHSDVYASRTSAATLELELEPGCALVTAIAPADVPAAALEVAADFAAAHGIVFALDPRTAA